MKDSTGELVVEYVYNAFGKIIDISGEKKDTIGVNNTMRYKVTTTIVKHKCTIVRVDIIILISVDGFLVTVSGGFIAGKYGNAITQKMSYGNVDWHIANINGGISELTNLCTYAVFCTCPWLASSSSNFGVRFLENAFPSSIGCEITLLLGNYEKPSLNDYRDEERIEREKGRFIWEYIL